MPDDGTVGGSGGGETAAGDLRGAAAAMLDRHWVAEGYAAPNLEVYPWQWLWDSCFHVLVWADLGDDRALVELDRALHTQAADGFVPHMNYERSPDFHADLWGRSGASSITQPPMFGHAIAELHRRGTQVPDELLERGVRGIEFLLRRRRRHQSGLIELCHPWESGADDSPRWDDHCPGGFELSRWREQKNRLVDTIERSADGSPIANPDFAVGSVGFSALVVFNGRELDSAVGATGLSDELDALASALAARWSDDLRTWTDAGGADHGSGWTRTADGLLGLLADPKRLDVVVGELTDPSAHGGGFGPTGVHRGERCFAPDAYWRGPVWPQLAYLLWVALRRAGDPASATRLAAATRRGAETSGLAEYWNPDTGTGLGAIPQSWTALAVLMD